MSTVPKYVYRLPAAIAAAALILCILSTMQCNFLSISSTDATTPFSLHFGFWYHQTVNVTSDGVVAPSTCTLYPPDQQVDSAWVAARVFNLLALIIGATVLLIDGCPGCISKNPEKRLRGGSLGYLIASFSSGMSLILLNTNICSSDRNSTLGILDDMSFSSCVISTGANYAIESCVLWFVAAGGMVLLDKFGSVIHDRMRRLSVSSRKPFSDVNVDVPAIADAQGEVESA